jgi:hypothetical protein
MIAFLYDRYCKESLRNVKKIILLTPLDVYCIRVIIASMARRSKTENRDVADPKIVIYTRIKPETVDALDEIRESMPFTPTRAQIIDAALAEYVDRHGRAAKKQREAVAAGH